jgi:hypothetical protein
MFFSGKHTYFQFVIHLDDFCDRGEAWRLWDNLVFMDRSVPDDDYDGTEFQWINFRGVWGNIKELVRDAHSSWSSLKFRKP